MHSLALLSALLHLTTAFTLPLNFDATYDPPLEVLLGQARLRFGLTVGGINLGVDLGKRGGEKRQLLGLNLPGLLSSLVSSLKPKPDAGFQGKTTLKAANIGADNEWSVTIGVGSPFPQQLDVVLDTGSTDAFLYESSCTSCDLNNHTAFDTTRSRTFKRGRITFVNQTFADGSTVTGYTGNDTITLGGELTIPSQLLGLVTRRSGFRAGATYDGIVGLSREAQSLIVEAGAPSIFTNAVRRNLLASPVVGVALRKAGPANEGGGGEYNFGEVNTALVRGEITYATVISKNAWGIAVDEIDAGTGRSLTGQGDSGRAIVDTGTTLIYVADNVAEDLHALIPGAAFIASTDSWTVPCSTSTATGAPNLFFTMAGRRFGVPASDLAFQGGWKTGTCLSGVQGGSNDFTVLGDVFIKSALSSLSLSASPRS